MLPAPGELFQQIVPFLLLLGLRIPKYNLRLPHGVCGQIQRLTGPVIVASGSFRLPQAVQHIFHLTFPLAECGQERLVILIQALRLEGTDIRFVLCSQFQQLILIVQFPDGLPDRCAVIFFLLEQLPQPDLPFGNAVLHFLKLLLCPRQLRFHAGTILQALLKPLLFGGQVILPHRKALCLGLFPKHAGLPLPLALLLQLLLQRIPASLLVLELIAQALRFALRI